MRFAILIPFLSDRELPGLDREAVRLANGARELGHEVQIITTDRRFRGGFVDSRPTSLHASVPLIRLKGRMALHVRGVQPSGAPLLVRGLSRAIAGYDLVMVFNSGWPLTLMLARLGGPEWPPVIYRTYWHPPRGRIAAFNWIRTRVAARVFGRAALLLAPTEAERELLRAATGGAVTVETVTPGVDLPRIDPQVSRREKREALGISPEVLLLVQVGSPGSFKGTDVAIAATAKVRRGGRDARLIVVGHAFEAAWMHRRVAALGAADWLVQTGTISDDEKMAILAAADVLLMLSEYEAFGFVALDAQAVGTSVITFDDFPSSSELAANGGMLVTRSPRAPCDVAELLGRMPVPCDRRRAVPVGIRTWDSFADEVCGLALRVNGDRR
jgi:glycosyltransferase involved in cell wall biosynthesis